MQLKGIYTRHLLPLSLHIILMQLWFCSAPSVIFKTSSEFLSRNMKILEIFLTELESTSLYLCSLNKILYSIACEGEISVGVKCLMSLQIIFLFLPSKVYLYHSSNAESSQFIDILDYSLLLHYHFFLFF